MSSTSPAGYGLFLAVGAIGDVPVASRPPGPPPLRPRPAHRSRRFDSRGWIHDLRGELQPAIAVSAYALEAIAVELGNIATISLRQQLIPPEWFGRVNNAFRMYVFGVAPSAPSLAVSLAAILGLGATFSSPA